MRSMKAIGEVRLDDGNRDISGRSARHWPAPRPIRKARRRARLAKTRRSGQTLAGTDGYLGNLGLTRLRTCAPRPGRGRCEALGCGRRSAAPIRDPFL
jgi:hypothetical protein